MIVVGCDLLDPDTPTGWVSIDVGSAYTCGLSVSGKAWCWGAYHDPYFGPSFPADSLMDSLTPREIPGGHRFTWVRTGGWGACGLDAAGTVYCWNIIPSLSFAGARTARRHPAVALDSARFHSIEMSPSHACGLAMTETAMCWGSGYRGVIGNGTAGPMDVAGPTAVEGPTFVQVAVGLLGTCALTFEGAAYCWGARNSGRVGDGGASSGDATFPTAVAGNHAFVRIATGQYHSCGIALDASMLCWGDNLAGQLGVGDSLSRSAPAVVSGNLEWREIAIGHAHTCGVTLDWQVYCWGANFAGQLGTGGFASSPVPARVPVPGQVTTVSTYNRSTCAINHEQRAFCWGDESRLVPMEMPAIR